MKKFSIVLSVIAAIAALVGIYFAAVEFLKRKGYLSDEEFDDEEMGTEEPVPEDENACDEAMSFNEEDEISFMEENAKEEAEEPKE